MFVKGILLNGSLRFKCALGHMSAYVEQYLLFIPVFSPSKISDCFRREVKYHYHIIQMRELKASEQVAQMPLSKAMLQGTGSQVS